MYRKCYTRTTALNQHQVEKNDSTNLKWTVFKKLENKMYILKMTDKKGIKLAPLLIVSVKFKCFCKFTEGQIFLSKNPNPEELKTIAEKLKWYRYKNLLLQSEVAKKTGINRQVYIRYENPDRTIYPIRHLKKIASLYNIPLNNLLDDYNTFLYKGQAEQIKSIRKQLNITQRELAKKINVTVRRVKGWEQNKIIVSKKCWVSLQQINEKLAQ